MNLPSNTFAANFKTELVKVALISEVISAPKKEGILWIGLHQILQPKWHTYWRYAGDSGLPTRLKWGKIVILEWTNHDCPYVRRQYMTENMQMVQGKAKDMGVVWMSIISSTPETPGYVTRHQANKLTASRQALPTHVVTDQSGIIGKLYGARTTPHMYILDTKGTLVYKGAIDDKPNSWGEIDVGTRNYVLDALGELMAGNRITRAATQPYGCSVKYGS